MATCMNNYLDYLEYEYKEMMIIKESLNNSIFN